MRRINIELEDFRIVRVLATEKNFRRAAEIIAVSPSALSRAVGRIEERAGAKLFERDTRNVELTEQGRMFLQAADSVLASAKNSLAGFQEYLDLRRGRITIAGLPSVTGGFLPELVGRFCQQYPNLEIRVLDSPNSSVIEAVEHGDADVGFAEHRYATSERLSVHPLVEDNFVAIAAIDGPLKKKRSYTWGELLQYPQVTMTHGTSVREIVNATYLQMNLDFKPKFEVAHLATAGALVSQGMGIAVLPMLTLPILGADKLLTRTLKPPVVKRKIGLMWRRSEVLPPAVDAFVKLVKDGNWV